MFLVVSQPDCSQQLWKTIFLFLWPLSSPVPGLLTDVWVTASSTLSRDLIHLSLVSCFHPGCSTTLSICSDLFCHRKPLFQTWAHSLYIPRWLSGHSPRPLTHPSSGVENAYSGHLPVSLLTARELTCQLLLTVWSCEFSNSSSLCVFSFSSKVWQMASGPLEESKMTTHTAF